MAPTILTDPHPLRADEHGVIRVGNSQVLLDVVIQEFHNGAEPEVIAKGKEKEEGEEGEAEEKE